MAERPPPDRAEIAIRGAAEPDLALLAGWMGEFFAHLKAATGDPYFEGAEMPPEAERRALFAGALAAGELLLVASLDGRPCGYLLGRAEPPFVRESPIAAIGHISHCYVVPAARRRGVARRLVAAAEDRFAARGLRWVELGYALANAEAAATWPGMGYRPLRLVARKALA
ncbi:MAG: GNAT family N-acetyltransferase [Dongiaceae bacterium]